MAACNTFASSASNTDQKCEPPQILLYIILNKVLSTGPDSNRVQVSGKEILAEAQAPPRLMTPFETASWSIKV